MNECASQTENIIEANGITTFIYTISSNIRRCYILLPSCWMELKAWAYPMRILLVVCVTCVHNEMPFPFLPIPFQDSRRNALGRMKGTSFNTFSPMWIVYLSACICYAYCMYLLNILCGYQWKTIKFNEIEKLCTKLIRLMFLFDAQWRIFVYKHNWLILSWTERGREERASVFGMNCQNHPRNDEKNQTRARSIAHLHNQMHRKSIKKNFADSRIQSTLSKWTTGHNENWNNCRFFKYTENWKRLLF